jgi:hypothetical protein
MCLAAASFAAPAGAGQSSGVTASTGKPIETPPPPVRPTVAIPRVERPPTLEDFLDMAPANGMDGKLLKLDRFTQQQPKDGQPATERTEAYLGYDDKNLYAIFVCFDSQPGTVRAQLARRENIYDDDLVQVMLDTFSDERRAYSFVANPRGVQLDRLYAEGQGFDDSFDTLWHSDGRLTDRGFVVWMAIPFRSVRFPSAGGQWGVVLQRIIPRLNEVQFWPYVSSRIQGRLNQGGWVQGLERISPGRNIQLIPYGVYNAFRALDTRDPNRPAFRRETVDGSVGLDAKFVIKDRLVLDFTVNPDFSQVESDEPQNTVNQRFEVFFPEKRPFFLENSSFFNTPISLLFTRRIGDPQFGARATGKLGRYAIGLLFADDQGPGRRVAESDPLHGKRAYFGIARVSRDIFKNSSVGLVYTERRFVNESNRVGGADFRFKFGKTWTAEGQAVTSQTRLNDGTYSAGPSYQFFAETAGRKLIFNTFFEDNSAGFLTQPGFFRRPDMRRFSNFGRYRWRPEGQRLISHGPAFFQLNRWDHSGLPLEDFFNANYFFEFTRQNEIGFFANTGHERLRPSDFSALAANRSYVNNTHGIFFYTGFFRQVIAWAELGWGRGINFEPVAGPPTSARSNYVVGNVTVRPLSRLTIDNRYIHSRLRLVGRDAAIFNHNIIRSKWNYQFSRELSLRFIAQYSGLIANPEFTALNSRKSGNIDLLLTYLLHPGTAVYLGYNSNLQNLDPSLALDPDGSLLRTRSRFINDGRIVFVKVSYLLRF